MNGKWANQVRSYDSDLGQRGLGVQPEKEQKGEELRYFQGGAKNPKTLESNPFGGMWQRFSLKQKQVPGEELTSLMLNSVLQGSRRGI